MQHSGGVAERSNAPVLKTGEPQGSVGSNPTSSANFPWRRTLLPKALLGFGMVLAMLGAIALVSYRSTLAFIHSANGAAHTHEVIELEESTRRDLADMENARRGYLLTGNETFLHDWLVAKQSALADILALRPSADETLQQHVRMARADRLLKRSIVLQQAEIDARRERGAEVAAELFDRGDAARVSKQIQLLLGGAEVEEKGLLERRAELMAQISQATIAAVLAGSALTLIAVVIACILIVRDVRALWSAEEALAAEHNLLRRIIDALPDNVYVKDLDGRFLLDNLAHRDFLGQPSDANIAGQSVFDFFPSKMAERFTEEDRYVTEVGESIINREERRSENGAEFWIQTTKVPLRDRMGNIIGLVGISADITERKIAEEKLRRFASQLERSNAELQDFASVASHDLQEPLRKIQAFSGRLRKKCEDAIGAVGRDYLERMENAAQRMQMLIQDLLMLARVTSHAGPFHSCNLQEIVQAVMLDLEVAIERTGATVEVGPLLEIQADSMQMRQLFQNLISNALKFHRPDVPPRIVISSRMLDLFDPFASVSSSDRRICEIRVQDNGIGFEEEFSEQIFIIFQRLHGRAEYEGTGVGLALCRKITDRHGGTIVAQAKAGQGATFVVTLPVQQLSDEVHE
jgi:PAS domain S-box-containing protein